MRHIQNISRTPSIASSGGNTSPLELVIELLLAVFFKNWDNFTQVYQGLSKYFAKTP